MVPPSSCRRLFPLLVLFCLCSFQKSHAFSFVRTGSSVHDNRKQRIPFGFSTDLRDDLAVMATQSKSSEKDQPPIDSNALFLNQIVAQLWEKMRLAGHDMILSRIEPRFKVLPGFLNTLRFTKIDLGEVPFRIDNPVVLETTEDAVKCEFDLIWQGECEINLEANYTGSIGVRSVKLEGRASLWLKPLTRVMPTFKAFQFAYINPPKLELEFTWLAQGAKNVVAADNAIKTAILDYMAETFVLPIRFLYNMLEQDEDHVVPGTYSFLEAYEPPLGIARVSLKSGRGFEVQQDKDVPDVYCNIQLGSSKPWRTRTMQNSLEPVWNEEESNDFLLSDVGQEIRAEAWDEDYGLSSDDKLGSASVSVKKIMSEGGTMELKLGQEDNANAEAFITLQCETFSLTTDLSSFVLQQRDDLVCGVLVILVTRAFDIPLPREKAATYVKVTLVSSQGARDFYTGVVTDYKFWGADALKPEYDCAFHFPLSTKMMEVGANSVIFELMNEDSIKGTTLGTAAFSLTDEALLNSPDSALTTRLAIGNEGASLEFRACLYGIEFEESPSLSPEALVESLSTETEDADAIERGSGTVCLSAVKGRGFKTKRRLFRRPSVPDVYCYIKLGSSPEFWRTSTIQNSVSPAWNESKHFPISSHEESVTIRAFWSDHGKYKADYALGSATTTIGELLRAGGTMDVELQKKGKGCGAFITIDCDMVEV